MNIRVFLTKVRAEERATRLRTWRLAELLIRFLADAVLANCAFLHHTLQIIHSMITALSREQKRLVS
jgi:hypothetical protein